MTGLLLFAAFMVLSLLVPIVWVIQVATLPRAIDARTSEVVRERQQVVRAARLGTVN